jgi:hypothetical protein
MGEDNKAKYDDKPMEKGGDDDCSSGPVEKRGCTDILFCLLFVAHWIGFVVVLGWSLSVGSAGAQRLVSFRDYKGAFCGIAKEDQWTSWIDMDDDTMNEDVEKMLFDRADQPKAMYTQNTTSMMMDIAESVVCSALGKTYWTTTKGMPTSDYEDRCGSATPSTDAAMTAAGNSAAVFTDPTEAIKKLTEGGGDSMMSQVGKYFTSTCVSDCGKVNTFSKLTQAEKIASSGARQYQFLPPPDVKWYYIMKMMWKDINDGSFPAALKTAMESFNFVALPESVCPDDPEMCVPFAGMEFAEPGGAGFCVFSVGADAADAMGSAASDAASNVMDSSAASEAEASFGTALGDIQIAAGTFALVAFLSFLVGIGFLILLRFTIGWIVWGAIIGVFLLLFVGGGVAVAASQQCKGESLSASAEGATSDAAASASSSSTETTTVSVVVDDMCGEDGDLEYAVASKDQRDMYMYGGYVLFALAGAYFILVICMLSRIQLAIAINKVAAQFVVQTKQVIFVPIVQVLIALAWWAIWLVTAIHLVGSWVEEFLKPELTDTMTYEVAYGIGSDDGVSSGTPGVCNDVWPTGGVWKDTTGSSMSFAQGDTTAIVSGALKSYEAGGDALMITTNKACVYDPVENPEPECFRCYLPRAFIATPQFAFAFFSLLWNNAFIIAVGQCTIAGAVSYWYFCPNTEKGQKPAIKPALRNCFRFHLGSLAFGSFILAVVQFIKWWMYYLQKQAEAAKNPLAVKLAKIAQYLIHCFERFLKFLNKNAYIQIALLGKNFCKSAWQAFCLILRNAARIGVLGGIGGLVGILGVCFITVFTAVVGYFMMELLHGPNAPEENQVSSPWICVIIFVFMGYVMAKLFMNVFAMAVDSVLQCFVADEELNSSGGGGGAQYTPELLKGFLKDPNKKGGCCKKG